MSEKLEELRVSEEATEVITVRRRRTSGTEGATRTSGEGEVHVWPHLVYRELICTVLVVGVLFAVSLIFDAPLEEQANPSNTPNPAKAAWYFLGLQELLVYFDPWFAGVVLPSLIVAGLVALPYLDINRGDGPGLAAEPRRLAVPVFVAGLAIWFVTILIGQYFRGLSWAWYWPWENWHIPKATEAFSWNFPLPAGLASVGLFGLVGFVLPGLISRRFYRRLGPVRYLTTCFFLTVMAAIPVKILLRLVFGVKYVLATPWFNL